MSSRDKEGPRSENDEEKICSASVSFPLKLWGEKEEKKQLGPKHSKEAIDPFPE